MKLNKFMKGDIEHSTLWQEGLDWITQDMPSLSFHNFFGIVTKLEILLYTLNLNIKTTMPEINEFILFIQYDQFMFI